MASVAFDDLTFSYPSEGRGECEDTRALEHVTLDVPDGAFVLVCGASGSGKTTLLRHLKTVLAPHGETCGRALVDGRALADISLAEQARRIGFVMQCPDAQIVSDVVWHELAFGLESLGCAPEVMRARVAEMASYLGIEGWLHRDVSELSGGQKQLLNLASALAGLPDVLVLDEPTAQLDPLAATELLQTIQRLNRELGVTVVMSEQRLEGAFPLVDMVALMEGGRIVVAGEPRAVARRILAEGGAMADALPAASRLWQGVQAVAGEHAAGAARAGGVAGAARAAAAADPAAAAPDDASAATPDAGGCVSQAALPLTVREGRMWLAHLLSGCAPTGRMPIGCAPSPVPPSREATSATPAAIELDDVWFRYARTEPDVLRGTSLSVPAGRVSALVGGNGSGKTTLIKVVCGGERPYRGRVRILGRPLKGWREASLFPGTLALVPQDPLLVFSRETVGADLSATTPEGLAAAEALRVAHLLGAHPADLSAGELQRAALAKAVLARPKILLLDEPTKGLDAGASRALVRLVHRLSAEGMTIVVVSHDLEFCAQAADVVSMLFDGQIASSAPPREFFSANAFYTTAASCIVRGTFSGVVTVDDAVSRCVEALGA